MRKSTRIQGRRDKMGPGTYDWTAENNADTAAVRYKVYEVVWRLLLLML